MTYQLSDLIFYKKLDDNLVNIVMVDSNDNSIYKLTKIAAQVFLMVSEKKYSTSLIRENVLKLTNKSDAEVEQFLNEFYQEMLKQKFFTEAA